MILKVAIGQSGGNNENCSDAIISEEHIVSRLHPKSPLEQSFGHGPNIERAPHGTYTFAGGEHTRDKPNNIFHNK